MVINFDTYLNSDEGGKQYIMRRMFEQQETMMQTIETLAKKVDDMEHRKGVQNHLKMMHFKSKPPDFVS